MKFQNVGYVRVSTFEQNTTRQLEGIELDRIFEDKISGKSRNRPALDECLKYVRQGDVLHVHSMDRLARNLKDMLALVEELNQKGVSVRFHKEVLTFTQEKNDPFATLMLHVIGACAEFERSIIHERQREGIASALKAGVKFGVKRKLSDGDVAELKEAFAGGESAIKIASRLGVSRQTIYRALGC